jgi:MFS family permease
MQDIAITPAVRDRRPLFALFVGNTVSMVGDILSLLAIPWFVLETTGSVTDTGITAFFSALPFVIATFLSGTLIDRLGFKRTSVYTDLISMLGSALVPLLYATVGLPFWLMIVIVFISSLVKAPGVTARTAIVPELAVKAQMGLERAASINDGISRGAGLVGAPLAGLLISFYGAGNVLWIDAATFLVSAIVVAVFVPHVQAQPKAQEASYFKEIAEGLHFIRIVPGTILIMTTLMITNFLDAGLLSVLYPVYAQQVFGNTVPLGLMIAAFGGGAVLGTVIFGVYGHRLPRRPLLVAGFVVASLRFWALAFSSSLPVLILVHALGGLAMGPVNPIMVLYGYERVPVEMRARVFGAITAGVFLANPVGGLAAGLLLEWLTLPVLLMIMGSFYFLAALRLLFDTSLETSSQPVPMVLAE